MQLPVTRWSFGRNFTVREDADGLKWSGVGCALVVSKQGPLAARACGAVAIVTPVPNPAASMPARPMSRSPRRNPLMLLSCSCAVNDAGWWVPFPGGVSALLVAEPDVAVVIDGAAPATANSPF